MNYYSIHSRFLFRVLSWGLLAAMLLLASCTSTKATRSTKRAERKVEKLMRKSKRIAIEAGITVQDTLKAIVTYIPAPSIIDTVIPLEQDSITIENDDLKIYYHKKDDGIKLSAQIKPTPKQIPVEVAMESTTKTIYTEKPLSKFQKLKLNLGGGLFWWLIVLLLIFIARFILKKYIPWIP